MTERWWDGCGAYVESWRYAKTHNGNAGCFERLSCGHEQQAQVGPYVGQFVICYECVATGRPKDYEG